MRQIDRRRLKKTYSFYRQRPLMVDDVDLGALAATSGSGGTIIVPQPVSDMNFQSFSMFHGTAISAGSTSQKDSIGMTFFDKSKINNTSGVPKFYFRAIFATDQISSPVYVELFDYSGFITGVPGTVAGSVLTGSSLVLGQLQVDLTSIFTPVLGSGIIETRMWNLSTGSNESGVIKSARLDVEWP